MFLLIVGSPVWVFSCWQVFRAAQLKTVFSKWRHISRVDSPVAFWSNVAAYVGLVVALPGLIFMQLSPR